MIEWIPTIIRATLYGALMILVRRELKRQGIDLRKVRAEMKKRRAKR